MHYDMQFSISYAVFCAGKMHFAHTRRYRTANAEMKCESADEAHASRANVLHSCLGGSIAQIKC